eukprot:1261184-Lingulodinium_polyedra.AAC.1
MRFGSSEYNVLSATWPCGPSSILGFACWPEDNCRALMEPARFPGAAFRQQRIQAFFGAGIIVHSDFSGKMGPEAAIRMQLRAVQNHCDLPAVAVCCFRASDVDS